MVQTVWLNRDETVGLEPSIKLFVLEPITSYTEIAWISSGISYLVQRTQIPKDVC